MNDNVLYIHRKSNLEVFYIGIGKLKRAYSHASRNKFWKHTVEKYGNPIVEILIDNLSWEEACFWEMFYISLYGRRDLKNGSLVNLTNGGDGVQNWGTPEERSKVHKDRIQKMGHDHVKKHMENMRSFITHEGLSNGAKKRYPNQFENLMRGMKNKWESMTIEEKKIRWEKTFGTMTREQRIDAAKRGIDSQSKEELSKRTAKGWEKLNSKQRSDKLKKSWETRRRRNENQT